MAGHDAPGTRRSRRAGAAHRRGCWWGAGVESRHARALGRRGRASPSATSRVGATTAIDAASSPGCPDGYGRRSPYLRAAMRLRGRRGERRDGLAGSAGGRWSSRTMARTESRRSWRCRSLLLDRPGRSGASAAHGGGGLILSDAIPRARNMHFRSPRSPWSGTRSPAFPTTGPS